MKRARKEVWKNVLLGSLLLLTFGTMGTAIGATETPPYKRANAVGSSAFIHRVMERINAASKTPLPETADAVLIRSKEWKWNRFLKSALKLPDWIDLGIEHRTRFEVYDHPWRTIQPLGRTDPQIQQRSRVRFGLKGGALKFLFEGQDSRVHLSDPSESDFLNTAVRNELTFCSYSYLRRQRMCSGPASEPTFILDDSQWTLAVAA